MESLLKNLNLVIIYSTSSCDQPQPQNEFHSSAEHKLKYF